MIIAWHSLLKSKSTTYFVTNTQGVTIKAESIEIFGDSQLVINQLIDLYECKDEILKGYYDECRKLLEEFPLTSL